MKTILYLRCILAQLLLCFGVSYAQSNTPLTIGDQFPEDLILNTSEGKFTIKDFYGKVVIFDFWNTTCTSCIEAFPKLEALKSSQANQLSIILVTQDSDKKVEQLFSKSSIKRPKLPLINQDSLLTKYFTLKLPHHVWLNKEGKIIAMTSGYNATAKNVNEAALGNTLNVISLHQYKGFNYRQPLYQLDQTTYNKSLLQYSVVTRFINGIPYSEGSRIDPETKRMIMKSYYNKPITTLLKLAYGDLKDTDNPFGHIGRPTQLSFDVRDSVRFSQPLEVELVDSWKIKNLYCYEVLHPSGEISEMTKIMQDDLKRSFKIGVVVKYQTVRALAFFLLDDARRLKSQSGMSYVLENEKDIELKNHTIKHFAAYLAKNSSLKQDIIDMTGLTDTFDFLVPRKNLESLGMLNAYFKSYGLELRPFDYQKPYLHIYDN